MAIALWFGVLMTLFTAAPAAAQGTGTPEPSPDQVTVTGQRDRELQVHRFVRALTPKVENSIPRLLDEVCPAVSGLTGEVSGAVIARIRRIAEAANMRVGRDGCTPNVVVLVRPGKQAFLKQLADKRPNWFKGVESGDLRRVLRSTGPVAVWRNEGPVDEDGIPLRTDNAFAAPVNESISAASRLRTAGRRATESAVMLIEADAINGLSAIQLADYAVMRLFTRTDPAKLPSPPPPTILTIMDAPAGAEVPITMTRWDLGLLRGLSLTNPTHSIGGQRAQIARVINRELDGERAAANR